MKKSSILNPQSSIQRLRIGVFDSGLGGLTVVKVLTETIKGAEFLYVADTIHAPYGEKTPQEILQYSLNITQYLIDTYQIDALVVACNTATSAAIVTLREYYPDLIIVGTEPAIKPAIASTKSGAVGVLATPATLKGDKYQQLADRLRSEKEVTLHEQACAGLVEHIEDGTLESEVCKQKLERWLTPMREANVDTIVLGCTHYPLAKEAIADVMQKEVCFLDAGEAIANRVKTLLNTEGNKGKSRLHIMVTGSIDEEAIKRIVPEYECLTKLTIPRKIPNS